MPTTPALRRPPNMVRPRKTHVREERRVFFLVQFQKRHLFSHQPPQKAYDIMYVLKQLYNFCGKGSLHSLFTVATIFSRGNRGRASVSQFPPAPMSSVDRKRYFLPTHKFLRKGLSTLTVYGRSHFFARKSRKSICFGVSPGSHVECRP